MSGTGTGEYFMRAGVARRIARRLEENTVSPQVDRNMSGTGTGEYFMRAGVARRIARRLEEDTVSPQVGRNMSGTGTGEVLQEAGGRYRLPTGGQKTCQVQGPGSTSCGPESPAGLPGGWRK
jgi:isoaspartyl peptidase/L-asparaginase-like protein (Ntn-hydrolase superfamily)